MCRPFFFFNDTATTEIYTLSLHDALPISAQVGSVPWSADRPAQLLGSPSGTGRRSVPSSATVTRSSHPDIRPLAVDRKSTRLNSSHANISYAVFCLKKKKKY